MIKNDVISTQRDNLCETQETRKARFYKGYRGCGKLSDVLDFKRYATRISTICIGHFSVRNYWKVSFSFKSC